MLITTLNIYNPLNNIKFAKEKKNLPSTWFLEIKVPYKKNKKEEDKDKSLHSPYSKY